MRIIVVEPEALFGNVLRFILQQAGHQVLLIREATKVPAAVRAQEPQAVLLQLDLPDHDGADLCATLRAAGYQEPIIVVTERQEIEDKLRAFAAGADDYLVLPIDPEELLIRLEVIARRWTAADAQPLGMVIKAGDAELSLLDHQFQSGNCPPVLLTPVELRLLESLMRNPGLTVNRDVLLERLWGEMAVETNRVDVYVSRLRRKIERNPIRPEYLHTVRGIGYVFQPPDLARNEQSA